MEREDSDIHQKALRLNKFLALAGVGSRRKNDELILSGAVKINGYVTRVLGVRVNPARDNVTVRGKNIVLSEKKVYILLNKPKDCITTVSDEKGRTTVLDYVRVKERVYPVGRLDRNTTGVLIMTNDGEFAHRMMHPSFEIEKTYRVTLDRPLLEEHVGALRRGLKLDDGLARAREVEIVKGSGKMKVWISMQEGRNREVRRMFEALRYDVRQLDRISFAGITPLGLPRGKWRFMTNDEVRRLKKLAGKAP